MPSRVLSFRLMCVGSTSAGSDVGLDGEAVVLRGDLDLAGPLVQHRLVGAAVAELQLEGLRPQRQAEQLVAQADAEDRVPSDWPRSRSADGVDGVVEQRSGRRGRWRGRCRRACARARPRPAPCPARPSPGSRPAPGSAGCSTSCRSRARPRGRCAGPGLASSAIGSRCSVTSRTLARPDSQVNASRGTTSRTRSRPTMPGAVARLVRPGRRRRGRSWRARRSWRRGPAAGGPGRGCRSPRGR